MKRNHGGLFLTLFVQGSTVTLLRWCVYLGWLKKRSDRKLLLVLLSSLLVYFFKINIHFLILDLTFFGVVNPHPTMFFH